MMDLSSLAAPTPKYPNGSNCDAASAASDNAMRNDEMTTITTGNDERSGGVSGVDDVVLLTRTGVSRDMRRISNPVDVEEETATINSEEVNVKEMRALRHGRETPTAAAAVAAAVAAAKNDVVDINASRFNYDVDDDLARVGRMRRCEDDGAIREGIREENDGSEDAREEDDNDRLRNASMWVAVPENYMDEDSTTTIWIGPCASEPSP